MRGEKTQPVSFKELFAVQIPRRLRGRGCTDHGAKQGTGNKVAAQQLLSGQSEFSKRGGEKYQGLVKVTRKNTRSFKHTIL